jgi:lipoprotein-releasing system permease protein
MARLPFSFFLALRYLKPKRTFVSVITLISIAGVTLGVAIPLVALSVMSGFANEMKRKVVGVEPHITLANDAPMFDWREVLATSAKVDGVTGAAPFVMGQVIAEFGGRRQAPRIRGIDPATEAAVSEIHNFIIEGELDLAGDNAVLGSELARSMGIGVGDTLTVYSPGNLNRILERLDAVEKGEADGQSLKELRELVLPVDLTVTGIFESGRYLYDSEVLLVPLHIGQELYSLGDAVHGISIRTRDAYQVAKIREDLMRALPEDVSALTWIDLNSQLFNAVAMERRVMFLLLFFIALVAAFSIMNTLITVTVLKTREIGILKAIGAGTLQIVWVFLAQGIVVGIIGVITGVLGGMLLISLRNVFADWLSQTFGVQLFPAQIYELSKIPAELVAQDLVVVCVSAFVASSLAALIPAYFAARLDPVKALRSE